MTAVPYVVLIFLVWAINAASPAFAKEVHMSTNECVIVLHGMGRTARSMKKLEKSLTAAGYSVWNRSYPSRSRSIEDLAANAIEPAVKYCEQIAAAKIHFVTHSLGGILIRYYLQAHAMDNLGRIVMLSPPNHGSEVADLLGNIFLYRWLVGPAGQQLGTDSSTLPNAMQPIAGEIGVITGNKSSDPWFSPFIPGPDDGKVSVRSAKLSEMTDFMVVPCGHTTIMNNTFVVAETLYFLQHGAFRRALPLAM